MGYSCESYSPRPDDFYFDDGSGGHVVKLELPESEKELLSAEDFLSDIRKIESAIEVSDWTSSRSWLYRLSVCVFCYSQSERQNFIDSGLKHP
ncbi:hypothetical protein QFC19_008318 [Naganishia cerealis]|uniref:Uncharacterized protein n=1 Tax=Naganishia cerealis TaxID=610337 RepID=A0ACC2V281_9TREE|nr:hypothetical protein QFC19_008318 [Naganishia cerealis]